MRRLDRSGPIKTHSYDLVAIGVLKSVLCLLPINNLKLEKKKKKEKIETKRKNKVLKASTKMNATANDTSQGH